MNETRLTLRVDFGSNRSIGPGKVRLLETIDNTGSISQAGRALGMSYRRAWLLIDDMKQCFNQAVTTARRGALSVSLSYRVRYIRRNISEGCG